MKKIVVILSIFMITCPNIVKAECTTSEKIMLSKMLNNIQITPIFQENTEKFNIIISNITPSLYFRDMVTKTNYESTGGEVILYDINPNQSYRLKFFSALPGCYGDALTSKYVTLPSYNKYYKDPLCENLGEYKFCQKWVNYNASREQFEAEAKSIEKKYVEVDDGGKPEEVKGFYDYLWEIYETYYYFVLPVVIIAGIIMIHRLRKKEDFF